MEARIDNLVHNLTKQTDEISSLNDDESSLFRLMINKSLEYDSDIIHKLILSNGVHSPRLMEKVEEVSSQIMDNEFEAMSHIQRLETAADKPYEHGNLMPSSSNETPSIHLDTDENDDSSNSKASGISQGQNEDLGQLRKRLLSRRSSAVSSSATSIESQNELHQTQQDNILGDMLGLVGQLKDNIAKFNEKIDDDADAVSSASRNLEKVGSTATQVGQKLKIFNDQGKVGFWFYIYVSVALVVVPLVMLLIIRLIPRGIF